MKCLQSLYVPILLTVPLQNYKIADFNDINCLDSTVLTVDQESYNLIRCNLFRAIFIDTRSKEKDFVLDLENYDDNNEYDAQLTSDLNLFPKKGTTYSEKIEPKRGSSSSKKRSTLTFRKEQTSRKGEVSSASGRSSATHPENMANFEKAGIPIDPIKNPNKKPDSIQNWRWDRKKQCWIMIGEERIQLSNGKIITYSEWQRMLIHKSRQT